MSSSTLPSWSVRAFPPCWTWSIASSRCYNTFRRACSYSRARVVLQYDQIFRIRIKKIRNCTKEQTPCKPDVGGVLFVCLSLCIRSITKNSNLDGEGTSEDSVLDRIEMRNTPPVDDLIYKHYMQQCHFPFGHLIWFQFREWCPMLEYCLAFYGYYPTKAVVNESRSEWNIGCHVSNYSKYIPICTYSICTTISRITWTSMASFLVVRDLGG